MFFEMRFDLGTLDSGERSLPFGLLVIRVLKCNIFFGTPCIKGVKQVRSAIKLFFF